MNPRLIPLPLVAPRLREMYGQGAPTYNRLYRAAVDGNIPIERVQGRINVAESKLPAIAAVFGLTEPVAA
jgi:hypothetical protein